MIDSQDLSILQEIAFRDQRNTADLERKFLLTRRQITYSIKKINELLSEGNQELVKVSSSELILDNKIQKYLQNYF